MLIGLLVAVGVAAVSWGFMVIVLVTTIVFGVEALSTSLLLVATDPSALLVTGTWNVRV